MKISMPSKVVMVVIMVALTEVIMKPFLAVYSLEVYEVRAPINWTNKGRVDD